MVSGSACGPRDGGGVGGEDVGESGAFQGFVEGWFGRRRRADTGGVLRRERCAGDEQNCGHEGCRSFHDDQLLLFRRELVGEWSIPMGIRTIADAAAVAYWRPSPMNSLVQSVRSQQS